MRRPMMKKKQTTTKKQRADPHVFTIRLPRLLSDNLDRLREKRSATRNRLIVSILHHYLTDLKWSA